MKLIGLKNKIVQLLCLLFLSVILISCNEVRRAGNRIIDEITEEFKTGPRALTDEDAFQHLSPDRSTAPIMKISAIQQVIEQEVHLNTVGSMMMESEEADELLHSLVYERLTFDLNDYELIDPQFLHVDEPMQKEECYYNDPNYNDLYDDYFIPNVEKIPVRNQRSRGTCAAFSGIGSIEYAAVNSSTQESGAGLPTLDLSEQRFYWMSKNDCQGPSGCECPGCDQGSYYYNGLESSLNDEKSDYNIPLETDCPYSGVVGENDTQYPQKESCEEGALRVEEIGSWCTIERLIELLHMGYAVPYGSPLSDNWEKNDGLITARGAFENGNSVHSGGHAYLIVGYRLLPDMPEEGGICFYVKNSWGTGWGVGGISCQTLEWMRQVTYEGFEASFPRYVPLNVSLREDLRAVEVLPDNNLIEEDVADDIKDEEVLADSEEILSPLDPEIDSDDDVVIPVPLVYHRAKLYGPNETFYEIEVAERDQELYIRGLLRQQRGETQALRVRLDGSKLIYQGDVVGRRSGEELSLCIGKWATLCSLRYREDDDLFYLQFRDDDLRSVKPYEVSASRGEWYEIDFGEGETYGIFMPNDVVSLEFLANPKTFIRLGEKQALRVGLRKVPNKAAFMLRVSGQDVGILNLEDPLNSELCSGDTFGGLCQLRGAVESFISPRNSGSKQRRR